MTPPIVFLETDAEDVPQVRERLPQARCFTQTITDPEAAAACAEAEVICCMLYSKFDAERLKTCPKLKLLCTRTVGYDHIDLEACRERGITVCNVPDYGSHVIAEHVFALLLSTLRHITEGDARVQRGTFDYHGLRGMALKGKTIGIVGTGRIGRATAEIAKGFGMRMLATDRCRVLELEAMGMQYVDLETLLAQSDIVSLHVPLLPETEHMINAESLRRTKPGVIVVNTARGGLIDSDALLAALETGHVRYALLDVLEGEKDYAKNKALVTHPRVVSTPHIAFFADDSVKAMYADALESVETWLAGKEPAHVVRPHSKVCDLPGISRKERA